MPGIITLTFVVCSLLLWDCDDRTYSYYIEVSNDRQNWEIVSDHRKDECKYADGNGGNNINNIH
jgi:hypothetical protein